MLSELIADPIGTGWIFTETIEFFAKLLNPFTEMPRTEVPIIGSNSFFVAHIASPDLFAPDALHIIVVAFAELIG